jgi:hypothetical protein
VPISQAINNYNRKSTTGFSSLVMSSWFLGDLFKTVYYISVGTPYQFVACGIAQFAVDLAICWQVHDNISIGELS